MSDPTAPRVLMMLLCLNCTVGGAEKQYARIFELLCTRWGRGQTLLISAELYRLLLPTGLLKNCQDRIIPLDPPFRKFLGKSHRGGLTRLLRLLLGCLDAAWYAVQCWKWLRRLKPDIAHPLLTGVYLSLPGLWLNPKVKRVLSAYSYRFVSYRDKHIVGFPIGATVKNFAMRRAHAVDALTEAIRQDLIERNIPADRVHAAPPCLFSEISELQPSFPKEPWVAFHARLEAIKNPLLFVDAMPGVLAKHPEVRFFIMGTGSLTPAIEQSVAELNLGSKVELGFHPWPQDVLIRSSVYVILQTVENYPTQSLLEGMVTANAIVATDVGETWRLVDESVGERVPSEPNAVVSAILRLLDDPDLEEKQRAARTRILTQCSIEPYWDYISTLYRQTAALS